MANDAYTTTDVMPAPAKPAGLVEFLLHLSFARTLDEVGAAIRTRLRGLVGADGIALILRDGDRCHYFDEDAVGPLWKGQKFPMTNCVSGWAMLNRQTVVIQDIYADARVPHEAYRPTFVKSLAMVPIRPDSPLGAIGAYWAEHRSASAEELSLMQTTVNAAALAIENARLYQGMQTTLDELERRKLESEAQAEERRRLLEQAEAALAQRDVLLREVHHRVKNNFQTIMSLLRLQQRFLDQPEDHYRQSISRIRAMAMVHQHLYESGDLSQIDFRQFLGRLAHAMAVAHGAEQTISIAIAGDPVTLDLDQAVPLSLLMNEILENSFKHAFGAGVRGDISINIGRTRDGMSITARDNGRGFADDTAAGGFGTRLITTLAQQLQASITRETGDGTRFRIHVPLGSANATSGAHGRLRSVDKANHA
jgi:two-component sensor histidine kinase